MDITGEGEEREGENRFTSALSLANGLLLSRVPSCLLLSPHCCRAQPEREGGSSSQQQGEGRGKSQKEGKDYEDNIYLLWESRFPAVDVVPAPAEQCSAVQCCERESQWQQRSAAQSSSSSSSTEWQREKANKQEQTEVQGEEEEGRRDVRQQVWFC